MLPASLEINIVRADMKKQNPRREHTDNIDESIMLSSKTSMMHQFFIQYCKHWWFFEITSMFHPYFKCFSHWSHRYSTYSPMKNRWNINEEIAPFTSSMAELQAMKLRIFQISSFPMKLIKNVCQKIKLKSKRALIRTLRKKIILFIKCDFYAYVGTLCAIFLKKIIYLLFFFVFIEKKLVGVFNTDFQVSKRTIQT